MNSDCLDKFMLKDQMSTFDPYDIWKTSVGFKVKQLYNWNKYLGLAPAATLTLVDFFLNNKIRLFYNQQEYPVVRAQAALALINKYEKTRNESYLEFAEKHVDWLANNPCKGYSGAAWGIGFSYPVSKGLIYDSNTPFTTVTPYAFEAMHRYQMVSGEKKYTSFIGSVFNFLENDIEIMYEDADKLATSYGPRADRIVNNAISYTMFCYALLSRYYLCGSDREAARLKSKKLYAYLVAEQRSDGAWLYSNDSNSFIDCFHSCFILKNIIKSRSYVELAENDRVISLGYAYLIDNFKNKNTSLFRRFSVKNKFNLVKYDLYDNAEMLNLAIMLGDDKLSDELSRAIYNNFVSGSDVYSQIVRPNIQLNKNTLRWAVMPFLLALSKM